MKIKSIGIIAFCLFCIGLAGCVKERPVEETGAAREEIAQEERQEPEETAQPSPRALASLELTDQGRRLIEAGKTDNAIQVLEQAISLNPNNGEDALFDEALAEIHHAQAELRRGSTSTG